MPSKEASIKQFRWLEGDWKLNDKDIHEKWQTVSDTQKKNSALASQKPIPRFVGLTVMCIFNFSKTPYRSHV